MSTSLLIKPALFVEVMRWSLFLALSAEISVAGLKSPRAKLSSMKVARNDSRFGFGLLVIAQSQLCCWSLRMV